MTGIEMMECNYKKSLDENYVVINGLFPDCLSAENNKGSFDFIIFNDVFEHIHDVNKTLSVCYELLKGNGYLIINLPVNTGIFFRLASLLALIGKNKLLMRLWQFETESPHLHYFSERSLKLAAKENNFSLIKKFSLNTVIFDVKNMRKRILGIGNISVFKSTIITLLVLLGIPLLSILPKDIKCFVFKKV